MNLIKKYISFHNPSIILISLPYFASHWREIYHSIFFSLINLFILFLVFIIIQFFQSFLYNNKLIYIQILSPFILICFITIFYGFIIVNLFTKIDFFIFKEHTLRGRSFILLFTIPILIIEEIFLIYKRSFFYVQNIFFTILFIIASLSSISNPTVKEDIHFFNTSIKHITNNTLVNKPIVLIITDEYSSPDELFMLHRDSSIFKYSKSLKENGWTIKPHFFSYETSTIHSLSSLFNFNLSKDTEYSKISISSIGSEKLIKSVFYDSLITKGISIINYGIFDLGDSKPIMRLYYYPKNFIELILFYSAYPYIFQNTGSLNIKGFQNSYYPMESHNRNIFNNLNDSIQKIASLNTFIYVHLYMPHGPMVLHPEFKLRRLSTDNYIEFWRFSNLKFENLLNNLTKNNKVRVIVTGDHGFRSDKKINPHYTFAAFYGFEKANLDSISSVQDLGSLINSYYK